MKSDRIISVVIADDHALFRAGVRQAVESQPGISIVAEASNGTAALASIKEHAPEIAILDVSMPDLSGLDIARQLQDEGSTTKVILLTMYKDEALFDRAMQSDVRGYLLKDSAEEHVLAAIYEVARDGFYYSPEISGLIALRERRKRGLESSRPGLDQLTPREREILRLIADSRRSSEIAAKLHISVRTVEYHRAQIGTKLGIKGSYSLLKFALEHKALL